MKFDVTPPDGHFFWSSWLARQSLTALATVFTLLSLADLIATLRLMGMHVISEGNAVANLAILHNGAVGLILYKVLMVSVVLFSIWIIDRKRPILARTVLAGGVLLMAVIALRHLAIMGVTPI